VLPIAPALAQQAAPITVTPPTLAPRPSNGPIEVEQPETAALRPPAGGGALDCAPTASGPDTATVFSYNPAGQIASRTSANDAYAWTGAVNVDRP